MPRGDGTGPTGMGALTGRGVGFCAGYGQPGFMSQGWGCGRGRGLGRGRGFGMGYGARWMAAAAPEGVTSPSEKEILERQAEAMQKNLDAIRQRLEALGQ